MEIRRELTLPCTPERAFAWIEDLALYPQWMRLIHHVEPVEPVESDQPHDSAVGAAWIVELRAQVGPFARSKVLRMVRSASEPPSTVTFERRELDGRQHSTWTLRASVAETAEPGATDLMMELGYGGSLWSGAILQKVLDDAIRRGSERLTEVVSAAPTR